MKKNDKNHRLDKRVVSRAIGTWPVSFAILSTYQYQRSHNSSSVAQCPEDVIVGKIIGYTSA